MVSTEVVPGPDEAPELEELPELGAAPPGEAAGAEEPAPAERSQGRTRRQPITPSWVTERGELLSAIEDRLHDTAHSIGWHAWRLPNYYGRLVRRCPQGVKKAVREWYRCALDVEGKEARRGHVGIMAALQGHERGIHANQYIKLAHDHER